MSFEFMIQLLPQFTKPLAITLTLWLLSFIIGLIVAVPVAMAAFEGRFLPRMAAKLFITSIRGTPLLVQFYIIYYGFGTILAQMRGLRSSFFWPVLQNAYIYALLALVISCAAYSAEILHGAFHSVPKGEVEAARALGLKHSLIWRFIMLPRAFHLALPTLGSEAIILLKSTVLASTITVMDLLGMANYIRTQTFRDYEPLLIVMVIYVILTLILSRLIAWLEQRGHHGR